MKQAYLLLNVLFCLCLSANTWATPTTDLSDLLRAYQSFSGSFAQTLNDNKGVEIQSSSGEFMIQQPGLFRWETQDPFPQLLVSDLNTIWLFDPDLEQVTIRPFDNKASQSPALLLSGNADDIDQYYNVTEIEKNSRYTLIPKDSNSAFTQMELLFDNKTLTQMNVLDSLEQTTAFVFSNIKTNQNFSDTNFQFEIPEGVDVLIDE